AGAFGRTMAGRLFRFGHDRDAGRLRQGPRRRAEGGGDVRASDQPEPLRDPLPTCDGKAAGNALAAPDRVRRDAGARRDDLPAAPPARVTGSARRRVGLRSGAGGGCLVLQQAVRNWSNDRVEAARSRTDCEHPGVAYEEVGGPADVLVSPEMPDRV